MHLLIPSSVNFDRKKRSCNSSQSKVLKTQLSRPGLDSHDRMRETQTINQQECIHSELWQDNPHAVSTRHRAISQGPRGQEGWALNRSTEASATVVQVASILPPELFFLVLTFSVCSGSHFNPPFTIGIYLCGGMEMSMVAPYIASQLVGGVLGAAMAKVNRSHFCVSITSISHSPPCA